jgi:hypothetical protein
MRCFAFCFIGSLTAFASACGSSSSVRADAGNDAVAVDSEVEDAALDSAVTDALAPDAGPPTFCSGTAVAGTCAQPFFQAAADCFGHLGGACRYEYRDPGPSIACWEDGALMELTFATTNHVVWKDAVGTLCLEAELAGGTMATLTRGGQTLVVDDDTDLMTCPDGTTESIPNGLRACDDLYLLFEPQCQNGTCPY